MHGKGYILKRVYLERNQEREYKAHQKRLASIKSSSVSVFDKVKPVDKQLSKSNKNHMKSNQFKEVQKLREEKVTNKALIDKLVDIQDGKYSVARKAMKDPVTGKAQASKSQKSLYVGSLNTVGRKLQEEKIARENHSLAQRMINLPPVIQKNRLDKDYKQSKELRNRILRFHVLKPKPEKKYKRMQYDEFRDDEDNDLFDPNDEELMNKKVQMVLGLKDIKFINFLPQNDDNEKYYLEVKASVRAMRETIPERYEDFSQSVINEFFYLKELLKSKLVYVGLYQNKGGKKTFLGDFELDLTPYYLESGFHDVHFDLRNYKELRTMPNYMHKDMRKKGSIDFYLQVHSDIKTFALKQKEKRDAEKEKQQQQEQQQQK